MSKFVLFADTRIGTLQRYAGEVINDALEDVTPILDAGGLLLPLVNPIYQKAADDCAILSQQGFKSLQPVVLQTAVAKATKDAAVDANTPLVIVDGVMQLPAATTSTPGHMTAAQATALANAAIAYAPTTQSNIAIGDVVISATVDGAGKIVKFSPAAFDAARGKTGIAKTAALVGQDPQVYTGQLIPASVFSPDDNTGSGPADAVVNVATGRPMRSGAYRPGLHVFLGVFDEFGNLDQNALPLSTTHTAVFDHNLYKTSTNTHAQALLAALTAAALVQGSAVYHAPGTYTIDQSILIGTANAKLQGAHRSTSILQVTGNLAAGLVSPNGAGGELGELIIEGYTLDLNSRGGFGGYCLFLQALASRWSHVTIRNCVIYDPGGPGGTGVGAWLVGASNVTLDHVDFVGGPAYRGAYQGEGVRIHGGCRNISLSYCTARMLNSYLSIQAPYSNIREFCCDVDGGTWTGPACIASNSTSQLANDKANDGTPRTIYTSNGLQDLDTPNFATATAGFPNGIVVRVFEPRVSGTITSEPTNKRYTLNDTTTFCATTIAAGSNNQTLPQGTINVGATASFASSGKLLVQTSTGPQKVSYSGKGGGGTTFTGCAGGDGVGVMQTGGVVVAAFDILEQEFVRSAHVVQTGSGATVASADTSIGPSGDVVITCTTGGTVGVGGIFYEYVLTDAGGTHTLVGPVALGTDTFIRIPKTGIKINLTAATWVVGDTITQTTIEANFTRDVPTPIAFVDGWRSTSTGLFVVGPSSGDPYTCLRTTLCQPSFPASNTASVGYWYGMDGTSHVPANGSRYEISPLGSYGRHVTGVGPAQSDFTSIGSTGKRSFGDPFSIWCAATLIGCYAEWGTDTCFTFNADDGVRALGCSVYMVGGEGFYVSSVASVKGRHHMTDCTVTRWGWSSGGFPAAAFRLFGIGMHASCLHAYAENEPRAIKCFEVSAIASEILDCVGHDIYSGNVDMQVYAGASNSLAKTFIRGRNKVDFTIPGGSFLGSPIWDLVTPDTVINGVYAGQPQSKIVAADGNLYAKLLSAGAGKTGWKIAALADPPPFSFANHFGSHCKTWTQADLGSVLDNTNTPLAGNGLAHAIVEQGLAATNPVSIDDAHRMVFTAVNAEVNGQGTLTMASNTYLDSGVWPGGVTIPAASQTWFIVAKSVNNGNTKYIVSGFHDGNANYAASGGAAAFSDGVGVAHAPASPAIGAGVWFVAAVVYDFEADITYWYENDATTPRSTFGPPGAVASTVQNRRSIGGFADIIDGQPYFGVGEFGMQACLDEKLVPTGGVTHPDLYLSMVALATKYGISIVT